MNDIPGRRIRAAKAACKKFASENGLSLDDLREEITRTDSSIYFTYSLPDGRSFGCGATAD